MQVRRATSAGDVGSKWAAPQAGRDYADRRFANPRAAGRDPRAVGRILERMGHAAGQGSLLDVPCGSGRLASALRVRVARYVGLDVSEAMLAAARGGAPQAVLCRGSAFELPFVDRSFDVVVCNRLLHHLEGAALRDAVGELVRVSSGLVIASFWDAASFPAWRRRVGLRRGKPDSRIPVSRGEIAGAFEDGGARVVGWYSGMRFLRMQTFVVARRS